jgi:hypothetical protein
MVDPRSIVRVVTMFTAGLLLAGCQPASVKEAADAHGVSPDSGPKNPDASIGHQDASAGVGEIHAANQAVLAFPPNDPNLSTLMAYAHPGRMVVLDPYTASRMPNGGRDFIRDFQLAGGEVLLYVDVMEVPDYQVGDASRLGIFHCASAGSCAASMPPGYFFPHFVNGSLVRLSNYPNTFMTDVTANSNFSKSVVDFLSTWDRLGAKGLFLDVIGTRLWTAAWGNMSASEQHAWTNGVYSLATRIRAAVGDNAILIANNAWTGGQPGLNGICIEHHDISEAAFWTTQMTTLPFHAGKRHLVIATSAQQAQSWRSVDGVTDITAQSDYSVQTLPVAGWPFTAPTL